MPELPEVETVRRALELFAPDQTIATCILHGKGLRHPWPRGMAKKLAGCRITGVERRAKYLRFCLAGGHNVIVHLGMTGSFHHIAENAAQTPEFRHERARLVFTNGQGLAYCDPRKFGQFYWLSANDWQGWAEKQKLGAEPFSVTPDVFQTLLAARSAPIKTVLLDQKCVVGIGNIYASESLFQAGIDPRLPANTLTPQMVKKLLSTLKTVLEQAIAAGGSTLRDHHAPDGSLGRFQDNFKVYGRVGQPCLVCKTPIAKIVQAGRSTFFCPRCQANTKKS